MAACSLSGFIRGKTLDVIPTLINGHEIYIYIYAYIYIYDSLWLLACWNNAGFNPKNTDYVTVSWCGVIPSLAKALWAAKSFNDPRLVENKGFHQWNLHTKKCCWIYLRLCRSFRLFWWHCIGKISCVSILFREPCRSAGPREGFSPTGCIQFSSLVWMTDFYSF